MLALFFMLILAVGCFAQDKKAVPINLAVTCNPTPGFKGSGDFCDKLKAYSAAVSEGSRTPYSTATAEILVKVEFKMVKHEPEMNVKIAFLGREWFNAHYLISPKIYVGEALHTIRQSLDDYVGKYQAVVAIALKRAP
jgi:hypothetical protein